MKTRVFVVFGAAVRPDGSASGTLRRRTLGAVALSRLPPARRPVRAAPRHAAAPSEAAEPPRSATSPRRFLVTGGQGRFGPAEAVVMRDLLIEAGVDEGEIELEAESRDTLESALRCSAILARGLADERSDDGGGPVEVVVATSRYHAPRCWLLLRLLGVPAVMGKIPADRSMIGRRAWIYQCLREAIAIPWDALLVLTVHRGARIGRGQALR